MAQSLSLLTRVSCLLGAATVTTTAGFTTATQEQAFGDITIKQGMRAMVA
jgi:hypothetical protein